MYETGQSSPMRADGRPSVVRPRALAFLASLSVLVTVLGVACDTSEGPTGPRPDNRAPVVDIVSPPAGSLFVAGDTVPMEATVEDPDGDSVPDENVVWEASGFGRLGTGRQLDAVLGSGRRRITVRATDRAGATGRGEVNLQIQEVPTGLTLKLTDAPAAGELDSAWVELEEVVIRKEGGSDVTLLDRRTGLIELTQLADSTVELVNRKEVPSGVYTAVRLRVGPAAVLTSDGRVFSRGGAAGRLGRASDGVLECAICDRGLPASLPNGRFTVGNEPRTIVLDVNVAQSFRRTAEGWDLTPSVSGSKEEGSGQVRGTVTLAPNAAFPDQCGASKPSITDFAVTSTLLDSDTTVQRSVRAGEDGRYRAQFLPPGPYDMGYIDEVSFSNDTLRFFVQGIDATQTADTVRVAGGDTVRVDYQITGVECAEANVARVVVSPDSVVATRIGQTVELEAAALDSEGDTLGGVVFDWSSLDPKVARMDAGGRATASGLGTARVVAFADGVADTAVVAVDVEPASIDVVPEDTTVDAIGERVEYEATVFDASGSEVPGAEVEWASTDESVVTVTAGGVAVSEDNGSAEIVATSDGGVSDTVSFGVEQAVANVRLEPVAASVDAPGETVDFEATPVDANGHPVKGIEVELEWSSTDTTVVTVDADGVATARGQGTAEVVAEAADKRGTATFSVDAGLARVDVTPDRDTVVSLGATADFSATALTESGDTVPDASFRWFTTDRNVATVDGSGTATGQSNGTAGIFAESQGVISDTARLVVDQAAATVTVSPTDTTLAAFGDTADFGAVVRDAGGSLVPDATVGWSSTDTAVATVDDEGRAVAGANGATDVIATSEGVADTAALTVDQAVSSVAVSPQDTTFTALGDTASFTATVLDANGHPVADADLTWSSTDTTVVTVDSTGTATTQGDGTAGIVATTDGVADTATVTVDATPPDLSSAATGDSNADGTVDRITVVFTDSVDDGTVAAGDFSLSTGSVDAVATGAMPNDDTVVLTVSGLPADSTDFTPDVTLAKESVDDTNGNTGPPTATTVTTSDGAAPMVTSAAILDRDADGAVDAADVTFSEPIDDSTIEPGDYTIGGQAAEAVSTTVAGDGDGDADDEKVQLRITTDANEAAGTDAKQLNYTPGTTVDLAGNELADVEDGDVGETDEAAPVMTGVETASSPSELSVDFSEGVWTDTNTPDAGDLGTGDFEYHDASSGGVSIAGVTHTAGSDSATVTLDGDAEAGSDSLSAKSNNIYDAADIAMSTTPEPVIDGTPPTIESVTTEDADGDGQIDRLTLDYSESVDVTDGSASDGLPGYAVSSPSFTIDDRDYGASGVTSLVLHLVESGSGDTGETPTVSYDRDATGTKTVADAAGNEQVDGDSESAADGAAPVMTSVVSTASDTLSVTFSEGVWTDTNTPDAGDLGTGDLDFIDASGGGVSLDGVVHTAGDASATVTLQGDAVAGSDSLAAKSNNIFDAADIAMPTTPEPVTSGTSGDANVSIGSPAVRSGILAVSAERSLRVNDFASPAGGGRRPAGGGVLWTGGTRRWRSSSPWWDSSSPRSCLWTCWSRRSSGAYSASPP